MKDFDLRRQQANHELVQTLTQYLLDHPSERFGQALRNLEIVREHRTCDPIGVPDWINEFNTEPTEMVKRAKAVLARTK